MNLYYDCVIAMSDLVNFAKEQSEILVSLVDVRKPITIYVAPPLDDFVCDVKISWTCFWNTNITTYVEYINSSDDIEELTKSIKKSIIDFVSAVKNGDLEILYTRPLTEATKEIKESLFWLFGDIA